eukprot:4048605-Pyramimonas_sp.AAC.1
MGGPSELFTHHIPQRHPLVSMSCDEGVHSVEAAQQLTTHEEGARAVPHEGLQILPRELGAPKALAREKPT